MTYIKGLAAVSLAMAISLAPGPAQALTTITVSVDCALQSLSTLLSSVSGRPPVAVVLSIKGTCTEDVTIEFDDITLEGDPVDGGTISGTITINGAQRVVIDNLTVTGPGPGIVGIDNAAFTVQNSDISNNSIPGTLPFCCDGSGIVVAGSSSALIDNNTINNNGIGGGDNDFGVGIDVIDASSAVITNNTISGNQADGIFVGNASSARVAFNTITGNGRPCPQCEAGIDVARSGMVTTRGNTITNNGYAAIQAFDQGNISNGLFVAGGAGDPGDTDIITQKGCPGSCEPGTVAMEFTTGSITLFRNAAITGTVSIGVFSTMRARTSTITGDVIVFNNAGVQLKDTMDFTGALSCDANSFTFFGSAVQCGQTCSGAVPGTCLP